MSELKVNKLSPESGTTLTLGDAGDTIVNNGTASGFLPTAGSDGNILTSDGTNWASEAPAGGGMHTLLTTVNASNSASVEFTSSIDSTYSTYMIRFDEVVPVHDAQDFYLKQNYLIFVKHEEPAIELQFSNSVQGSYKTATAAIINEVSKTITVNQEEAVQFYRLKGISVKITKIDLAGGEVNLTYQ